MGTHEDRVARTVWPTLTSPERALWRSQKGPLACSAFMAFPTSRSTRIDPQPFRVLLCRRLHLPLPFSSRTCRCGRLLDCRGHHRAACAEAGVLGARGFALERAAAQVCREGGGRVSTNVMVRNLDIEGGNPTDARRLEIVVDGLTLFDGAQLAIDTTLVSHPKRDGTARRRAADHNGAALEEARRKKENTYPELAGDRGLARLVVFAAEVGGRWSDKTANFLSALSKAKAETAPEAVRDQVRASWLRRWRNLLGCTAARAFATSLLEKRCSPGVSSTVPAEHEVLRESRFL